MRSVCWLVQAGCAPLSICSRLLLPQPHHSKHIYSSLHIWGQLSDAHNWIPGWRNASFFLGAPPSAAPSLTLSESKRAKKRSIKYQRCLPGFVSYLWKFMFCARKVFATLPLLSSPQKTRCQRGKSAHSQNQMWRFILSLKQCGEGKLPAWEFA